MGLIERWRRFVGAERTTTALSFQAYWDQYFTYLGNAYMAGYGSGSLSGNQQRVAGDFMGLAAGAYGGNAVVFACMLARQMLFSEARFAWRDLSSGRPGDITITTDGRNPGSRELALLLQPWEGATTGDLLSRMINDADIAGNAFVYRDGGSLRRLRPDWTYIVYDGDPRYAGTEVAGYRYCPGGPSSGEEPVYYPVQTVAHFAPVPDPLTPWIGMSWLTPIIREIEADSSATTMKRSMLEQGGTPSLYVKTDPLVTKEIFEEQVKNYRNNHEGSSNAGKAWFMSPGFDPTILGSNLQELDFKSTQGAGETRIAAASGIHPVVVGLSEGLAGSSLNAGNFQAARRLTADKTLRPLWRNVCGSLARIITEPQGSELWYDEKDIAFLREDEKDAAEILQVQATAIKTLVDGGFEPDAARDAVVAGDLSQLEHTGRPTVQVQKTGQMGNGEAKPSVMVPVG